MQIPEDAAAHIAGRVFDTVVVGAGFAGITFAREWRKDFASLLIIESGEWDSTRYADDLKETESDGIHIRLDSRERVIGGSSHTWSGALTLLEPVDFDPIQNLRPGWPITFGDLFADFDSWRATYGFPSLSQFSVVGTSGEARIFASDYLEPKIVRIQNPPIRLGPRFIPGLVARGLSVLSGFSVSAVDFDSERNLWVAEAEDEAGEIRRIESVNLVIAAGAIETVRLLKDSAERVPELELPALGKYFMNHPKGTVGEIRFTRLLRDNHPFFSRNDGGYPGITGIRLSDEHQKQGGFSNSYIRLVPIYSPVTRVVIRVMRAAKAMIERLTSTTRRPENSSPQTLGPDAVNSFSGFSSGVVGGRRFGFRVRRAAIAVHADMLPSPDNEIGLSSKRRSDGRRTPRAVHRLREQDLRGIRELLEKFRLESEKRGLGRAEIYFDEIEERVNRDASHHLGGARMGLSGSDSVVNPNLEVHGLPGLFLLGGAVFPTGGNANPSVTIAALARRLSLYLSSRSEDFGTEPVL